MYAERAMVNFLIVLINLAKRSVPIGMILSTGLASAAESVGPMNREAGPYCGLYCVFAAINSLGGRVSFENLLQPKYMRSEEGSSLFELKKASIDAGVPAVGLTGLGTSTLRDSKTPMILHIASEGQLASYDHWILFLGMDGASARIMDAPNPIESIPLADLLSRWDGTALVFTGSGNTVGRALSSEVFFGTNVILSTALLMILFRCIAASMHQSLNRLRTQMGFLGICVLATAVLFNSVEPESFLRNSNATAYVAACNVSKFFNTVSTEEMRELVSMKESIIVDARYPGTYAQGHIPDSINLPVDATPSEVAAKAKNFGKSKRIVIYCHSLFCDYDEIVGTKLSRLGFTNISMYPAGWLEWSTAREPKR